MTIEIFSIRFSAHAEHKLLLRNRLSFLAFGGRRLVDFGTQCKATKKKRQKLTKIETTVVNVIVQLQTSLSQNIVEILLRYWIKTEINFAKGWGGRGEGNYQLLVKRWSQDFRSEFLFSEF